ncbi:LURP-one-like protein [Actinidia rufa]|uniref:LURP-one-like protein n=1 Tax=Actinidia rufa TaxID=165716 RepID=A0A7J0FAW6_9ERIC|nr:LURP-one-like protein [Actinidia rufa]
MAAAEQSYPSPPQASPMAHHSSAPPPLANTMPQQSYASVSRANSMSQESYVSAPLAYPMEQQSYASVSRANSMEQQYYASAPLANPMPQQSYASTPLAYPIEQQSYASVSRANSMEQPNYVSAPLANPKEQPNYAPLPLANPMPQPNYAPLPQVHPMPQQNYVLLPQANPMPQQNYAPLPQANPMAIVSPQFCAPNTIELAIVRKVLTMSDGNFGVTDVNGNPMFKVRGRSLTLHDKRVLLNSAGYPIITLREKVFSAHSRWQVFRGESSDTKDLIFSAKTSSMFQVKSKLDVFLANNITEEVCDFKVKGNWSERSCVIYAGESSNIVAQMHKKKSVQSVLLGKDKFMVTVYPHVDHAFIVALIVILDEINSGD